MRSIGYMAKKHINVQTIEKVSPLDNLPYFWLSFIVHYSITTFWKQNLFWQTLLLCPSCPPLCFVFLQHHQNSAMWPFLGMPQFTRPVVGGSSFQGQECLNSRRECGERGHPDYGHHVVITCNLFYLAGFLSANSHLKQPVSENLSLNIREVPKKDRGVDNQVRLVPKVV